MDTINNPNTKTRGRFITPRTASFFNRAMRELTYIRGQSVLLYRIDPEATHDGEEDIYRESNNERFLPPVRIMCRIDFNPFQEENFNDIGLEKVNEIDVYIQLEELVRISNELDEDVYPNQGDIIMYHNRIYLVGTEDDSNMIHGSPEYPFEVALRCRRERESEYKTKFLSDIP